MTLFQGAGADSWTAASLIIAAMITVATWYIVIIGRDRPVQKQEKSEDLLENYGDIEENHAVLPKFLIYTFIGSAVWAAIYLIWTGLNGVTGYR